MNITVVGAGKIGRAIIDSLAKENHDILVIDKDQEMIDALQNSHDLMGICGDGINVKNLEAASMKNCNLFVATTGSDEHNMLSCLLAKSLGAKYTVARVRNSEYSGDTLNYIKGQLDISMIFNTDLLTAQTIYNNLKFPSAIKYETFSGRKFELAELTIKEDSIFADKALSKIKSQFDISFLVCYVNREGMGSVIPSGDFMLKVGDKIGLVASPLEMQSLLKRMGVLQKKVKNVMILGASRISIYLANMLADNGYRVRILEKNEVKSHSLGNVLNKGIEVVHADGTNSDILAEESIESQDSFVALTGLDELNILMAYHAMDLGVPKVIAKVNQETFVDMSGKLGVDCAISPNHLSADLILKYARALNSTLESQIETLYSLMNGVVEALEFIVSSKFSKTGLPLKELALKKNILIAGIIRDNKTIIPNGNDTIEMGDHVIVIAKEQKLSDLSDILL